ncbi:MAG TPA: hypothetical protein VKX39_09045 [Bryobacteraceae bacterium]|jgi:hypothetical protein|nr:hypothetical protein [Bryobacteraceae bacterium]
MADDAMRDPAAHPIGTRIGERLNLEKVSWGAIWAGSMVTIGMELLFLSFGVFIDGVLGGSTPWAMAWYLITMAVSFYAGAATAARLFDIAVRDICVMHGLATWGVATLATAILGAVVGAVALFKTALPASQVLHWGGAEQWGGVIWGGVLLSLLTAYMGGGSTVRGEASATQREVPASPMRRAS